MSPQLTKFSFFFLVLCLFFFPTTPAQPEDHSSPCSTRLIQFHENIPKIVESFQNADVLVIGEEHNDKNGHAWKLAFLEKISHSYNITLSLEMLEWHQRKSLREYLSGVIPRTSFMKDSVYWNNFTEDYLPLVDCAKSRGLRVIPANPPRKYIHLIAREGMDAYKHFPAGAKNILPKPDLLLRDRSSEYETRLRSVFQSLSHSHGETHFRMENQVLAQHAWDAGMTESIVNEFYATGNKIVHINGRFHSDYGGGVVYRLKKAGLKVLTVSLIPNENQYDPNLADYVILTKQPIK